MNCESREHGKNGAYLIFLWFASGCPRGRKIYLEGCGELYLFFLVFSCYVSPNTFLGLLFIRAFFTFFSTLLWIIKYQGDTLYGTTHGLIDWYPKSNCARFDFYANFCLWIKSISLSKWLSKFTSFLLYKWLCTYHTPLWLLMPWTLLWNNVINLIKSVIAQSDRCGAMLSSY